jgi:ubiquinol-cytochrome c reductase iron-sulfur subunit
LASGPFFALWTLLDSLKPSADVQALSTTAVELAPIQVGQAVTVLWQGKTMFIDHGTPGAIGQAEADGKSATLLDPAKDELV